MIPQGMALQKSLTGKEEQMLFTGAGPKTKPKIIGNRKKRKQEKKGNNNLATFGIHDPLQQSIDELLAPEEARE